MCPLASVPSHLDIDASGTDEEVMLFLGGRTAEDPVPSNIITNVNPFSIEPWDSPEGVWYLYHSEDGQSCNLKSISKVTKVGYWRSMGHILITADNVIAGRKTTWEFYIGQEPFGNKTGWLMYDYHKVPKNFGSFCRVFLQDDRREAVIDHCSPARLDDVDDELLDSMLLHFLEEEERCSPSNVVDRAEAIGTNEQVGAYEQRQVGLSNRSIQDVASLNVQFELTKGEYLELEDLYDLESTSSSSDNSSVISSNSDECFDAEALLRDIKDESNGNMQSDGTSSKHRGMTVKPSLVIIGLHSADSLKSFSYPVGEESVPASISPPNCRCSKTSSPRSTFVQEFDANTSLSGPRTRGHPKRTHSGSSESSCSSSGAGSKSFRRIAKLGKKYCCLAPF